MARNPAALRILGMLLAVCLAGMADVAYAADGVEPGRIVFGQVAALDGPAGDLGRSLRDGLRAAFAEANAAGGVGGRKLDLISIDDGYEPERAIAAARQLIGTDHVFALVGGVGAPAAAAVKPLAAEAGVPLIGAFTGSDLLRTPFQRSVINLRSSYSQETEELVKRLTGDLGLTRIAVLYEDDTFGRLVFEGVVRALDKRNLKLAAEGVFERNTTAVRAGLLQVRRADPQAIVMVGPYQPVAEIVRLVRLIRMDAVLAAVSFVGAEQLARELGPDGDGVIVSEVLPSPTDRSVPMVARYLKALQASAPDVRPGYVSLEGYAVGRLVIDVLGRAGPDVTRESFLAALYARPEFDLDGLHLVFGPGDNQGLDDVFLSVLKGGQVVPVTDLSGLRK